MFSLIQEIYQASQKNSPLKTVSHLLTQYAKDLGSIKRILRYYEEVTHNDGLSILLRIPELTIMHVEMTPEESFAPHCHHSWACILLLQGQERNTFYKKTPQGLVQTAELVFSAGDIVAMQSADIHAIQPVSQEKTLGLHVYGADIVKSNEEYD